MITSEYLIKLVKACTVISGPGKMMMSTESIKVSQYVRAAITSYGRFQCTKANSADDL